MKLKLFLNLLFIVSIVYTGPISDEEYDKIAEEQYENAKVQGIAYPNDQKLQNFAEGEQKYKPKIVQPDSFDIEKLKKQFQDYDCLQRFKGDDLAMQQCLNKLEQAVFGPFENFNSPRNSIYGHISRDVYLPLAYNSFKQSSYADIIKELIFKNDDENILNDLNIKLDFDDFQYSVIQSLQKIENKADYNTENQKDIVDGVVNILRDFHVYWNAMRMKNKVNEASANTIKVVENIIKKYQVKESFMFQLTKILVLKLESAFQRFIKAHLTLQILKENVSSIIIRQVIQRYIKLAQVFFEKDFTDIEHGYIVKQTSIITDFCKILLINLYKENKDVNVVKQKFESSIINQIQENYDILTKNSIQEESRKTQVKHITATLLLKLKHVYFIFFNYNSIEEVINAEAGAIRPQKSITVKVYYELMDNMILLPGKCLNAQDLGSCIYLNSNKIFNHIIKKYGLIYSQSGQIIYRYLRQLIQGIFSDASQEELSNLNLLKKFYYKKLFAQLFEYKIRYKIKDTMELDDLETEVGDMLMAYKLNTENELVHINYKILDQLDLDIYNKFLTVKSKFDDYVPIYQDKLVVLEVHDILCQFLDIFEQSYKTVIDDNFKVLVDDLKKLFDHWRDKMLEEYKKEHKRPEIQDQMIKKYPELFDINLKKFKFNKNNLDNIHEILGPHTVKRQQESEKDKQKEENIEEKAEKQEHSMEQKEHDNSFVPFNKKPFDDLKKRTDIKPLEFDYEAPKNKHITYNGVQGILGDSYKGPDNIPSDIQHADPINSYDLNPEHTVNNEESTGDTGLSDAIEITNSYKV